ncbi:carbohydrate-binding protein [Ekhidna sp.]|uniref:carbohydrate-binding protein n=1 Tax=Ekhidna sp. TaxID=2608089 RepID=UPI003B50EAB8
MKVILVVVFLVISLPSFGQGLKANGKVIVDNQGAEVLLRGLGPGGWQIMEGYMMQTSGIAGTQHEIREKLVVLMGEENTETFFRKWRENHFTQRDVDSLAAWGFNSIRIPLHYNLFTLPIEDEPVQGEHTWIETGFQLIDSVLKWSAPHDIYVILDMHACPGGQGTASAEINDYDPDKSSLWEDHPNDPGGSQRNKEKLVALWTRIAERYKDEEWIGGYDLINEPHFDLPGGTELRELYEDITDGIRSVDTDHIIYIEGNWYANDYTGLTPPWDDNMVYSFHKYWSFNNENDLDWVLPMRDQYNVPLWMGESGENSNTWFTDAVKLFEENNIGWAWWTIRKVGDIDSPYAVDINPGYQKVIDYWKGEGPQPTEQETFDGMMQLAENLLVENSRYRKDVPDALFRQLHTDETIPYSDHQIPGIVYLSDYDLGKNGFAYFDKDVADYHLSTGEFQAWNSGWSYRNDGVDIQSNEDEVNSNGFHIGFTDKGEWIKYTVNVLEQGVYRADVRHATDVSNSKFHLSIDNQSITTSLPVPYTGGWEAFTTMSVDDILLEAGTQELRIHFDQSAVNVGSIEFVKEVDAEIDVEFMTADVGSDEHSINLFINQELKESSLANTTGAFEVSVNGTPQEITEVILGQSRTIVIALKDPILFTDQVKMTYSGSSIVSMSDDPLRPFTNIDVLNNLDKRFLLPGKIQAEDYEVQVGFGLEETTDTGGGQNIGYTDVGDFADYKILVREEGMFSVSLRVAAQNSTGRIGFYLVDGSGTETKLIEVGTPRTGGWQTWETVTGEGLEIPVGIHILRMKVLKSGFNLNWFEVSEVAPLESNIENKTRTILYPNPTERYIKILGPAYSKYEMLDIGGSKILSGEFGQDQIINVQNLKTGIYVLLLTNYKSEVTRRNVLKIR